MALRGTQSSRLRLSASLPETVPFELIVRAHQGAVRAFLRRLVRNDAQADDLAQDAFIKAYAARDQLPEVRAVRSWLYRIAYRVFLDARRKAMRRDALEPEPAPPVTAASGTARLDIERAMGALPPERRACALLGLALGYSHADIAEITGLPLGTVKSHIARAKAALREVLHDYRPQ